MCQSFAYKNISTQLICFFVFGVSREFKGQLQLGVRHRTEDMGFSLFATKSTYDFLSKNGVSCSMVYKPLIKRVAHRKEMFELFRNFHSLYLACLAATNKQTHERKIVFQTSQEPNVLTLLQAGKMDMVINVPDCMDSSGMTDGFKMRRGAIEAGVPLITDIKTAIFACSALHRKWQRESSGKSFWDICSWQEYVEITERLNWTE